MITAEWFFVQFFSTFLGNNKEFFLFFATQGITNGFGNTCAISVVLRRKRKIKARNKNYKMVEPDTLSTICVWPHCWKILWSITVASFSPFDAVTLKLVRGIFCPVLCRRDQIPRGPDLRDPLHSPKGSAVLGLLSAEAGWRAGSSLSRQVYRPLHQRA